jgi:phospholipid transport system transporter-binding protein
MISEVGECARVSGRLGMREATDALEAGRALIAKGVTCFDLAEVTDVDSAALAVIFAWQREARRRQMAVSFSNPPASLASLAEVYGVTDLLAGR